MSDDAALVMCVRVDEDKIIVPGSVIRTCRCGADVWVAPATFVKTEGMEPVLVCEQCTTPEEREMFADYLAKWLQALIDHE